MKRSVYGRKVWLAAGVVLVVGTGVLTLSNRPILAQTVGRSAAASPMGTAFTYQGRLDKNGSAVTDTCDFEFSLWDDATTPPGNQLGTTQTKNSVDAKQGLFTVDDLDFGEQFNGRARWLELAVKCTGETSFTPMTTRQALTPTPHALALPQLRTYASTNSVVGGHSDNEVAGFGATIGGGGAAPTELNRVTDEFGTVGGGANNQAGDGIAMTDNAAGATVGGGMGNTAGAGSATVGGGDNNTAGAVAATIGGGSGNQVTDRNGTIAGGINNRAGDDAGTQDDAQFATVAGGNDNSASGWAASVGGGNSNVAEGAFATTAGGLLNLASASHATVGGGLSNAAQADFATVAGGGPIWGGPACEGGDNHGARCGVCSDNPGVFCADAWDCPDPQTETCDPTDSPYCDVGGVCRGGGVGNMVYDNFGTIGGGAANRAGDNNGDPWSASHATVGGGHANVATAPNSTIGGGDGNQITSSGYAATIGGGGANEVSAGSGTIAGGGEAGMPNRVTDEYGTIGGGLGNLAGDDAGTEWDANHATVGGGVNNTAGAGNATVGGGSGNRVTDDNGTIAGGINNQAGNDSGPTNDVPHASVGGGNANWATGYAATVSGGEGNGARAPYATVGGGKQNTASAEFATVGGGEQNTASGLRSAVPGGAHNIAASSYSFAAGQRAWAKHYGTFVWSDGTTSDPDYFQSTNANQFLIKAGTGVGIGTNDPQQQLDVAGTIQMTGFKLTTSPADGYVLTSDTNGVGTWQAPSGGGSGYWTASGNAIYNNNTGYVGIGTPIPFEQLHVAGNFLANGTIRSGTSVFIDGTAKTINSEGSLELQTWGVTSIYIDGGHGSVGIGTTNIATAKLVVRNDNNLHAVLGETSDNTNMSAGVRGIATAPTGATHGVSGKSESSTGKGVYGVATATSGTNYGVYGRTESPTGYAGYFDGDVSVNGDLCSTSGSISTCSDARLKKNVQRLRDSLSKIARLRGVQFDWKRKEYPDRRFSDQRQAGLIAQEVKAVLPEVVIKGKDGFYFVDYGRVVPTLVEAVKELHGVVKEKDARITAQHKQITELSARMAALERATGLNVQPRQANSKGLGGALTATVLALAAMVGFVLRAHSRKGGV